MSKPLATTLAVVLIGPVGLIFALTGTGEAALVALDIGGPAILGSTQIDVPEPGQITILASGNDIWGNADQFHFYYEEYLATSNIVVQARVLDVSNVNPWAKAGVMIRDLLGADSINRAMLGTPGPSYPTRVNRRASQYRDTTGGNSGGINDEMADLFPSPPGTGLYVHVTLDTFLNQTSAEYSRDGEIWNPQGDTRTWNGTGSVFVGLAVTSHTNATLTNAVVSDFSITGGTLIELIVWNESGNGNWNSPHWLPEGTPHIASDVTIETDTVTVGARAEAHRLSVKSGGGVVINDGQTLEVTDTITTEEGTSVAIGHSASLNAAGGTIDSLFTSGDSTWKFEGELDVSMLNDGGVPGTLSIQGGGNLITNNRIPGDVQLDATIIRVTDAIFSGRGANGDALGGSTKVILGADGGLDLKQTATTPVANSLVESCFPGRFGDRFLDPIDSADGLLTQMPGHVGSLEEQLSFGQFNDRCGGLVPGEDNLAVMWQGTIHADGATVPVDFPVTFGTSSDDASVVWIDLDDNGLFEHDGANGDEMIVDNKGFHANQTRVGQAVFPVVGEYNVAIGFYEAGGGQFMEVRWAPGSFSEMDYNFMPVLDPTDPAQAGVFTGFSVDSMDLTGVDVDAIGLGASIKVITGGTAVFGNVNIAAGKSLHIASDNTVSFNDMTLGDGATIGSTIVVRGRLASAGAAQGPIPATMNIGGDLTVASTATVVFALQDEGLGQAADRLAIAGDLAINAGSTIAYVPHGINRFKAGTYTLISSAGAKGSKGILGSFTQDVLRNLGGYVSVGPNGDGLTYTAGAVTVTLDKDLHQADFSMDTLTDGSDFNIWNAHKFTSGTDWYSGDATADGDTDGSDFNQWNQAKFTEAEFTEAEGAEAIGVADFLYDPDTGVMVMDTGGDTLVSMLIEGPQALSIDGFAGGFDLETGTFWTQQYFAGKEQWIELTDTGVDGVFKIATYAAGLTAADFGGRTLGVEYGTWAGDIVFTTVTVIPEPSTLSLLAFAALGLLAYVRRKRRRRRTC